MTAFATYLKQIADEFPSRQALARAIGITPPRLSRAIAGEDGYTLNVENCLRLALAARRPAVEVLRAAGKGDVADLLESLFPKSTKALPAREHTLLTRFRKMNAAAQTTVLDVAARLVEHEKNLAEEEVDPPAVAGRRDR